jgi:hypothetical protein
LSADWFNNVHLLVSASDGSVGAGIEICENTIDGAAYPLGLINHIHHPTRTRQVTSTTNVTTLRASTTRVGAVGFDALTELFTVAANSRFDYTYRVLNPNDAYWEWNGQKLSGASGARSART